MATNPYDDPDDPITAAIKKAMGGQTQSVVGGDPVPGEGLPKPVEGGAEPALPLPPITGGATPEVEPTKPELPDPDADPVTTPTTPTPKYDWGRTHGYDEKKFNDPTNDSYGHAKYVMGRTLSQFDPRKGVTSEVLAALNALGYGTFSGSGDKLSLKGLTAAGRAAGLNGDYENADFIEGLKGGDGHWSYSDPFSEAADGGGSAAGPMNNSGGSGMTLSLDSSGVPSDEGFFNKLMEAAQKAQGGNMTRKSLLELLGLG